MLREWSDLYLNHCNARFVDNWNKALQSYGVNERQVFSFLSVFSNMSGDVGLLSALSSVETTESEQTAGQGE